VPLPLIRGLTHRNLPGSDYTDCSFFFLYMLCSMAIRPNVQKLLGFTPPKTSGGMFGGAQQPSPW